MLIKSQSDILLVIPAYTVLGVLGHKSEQNPYGTHPVSAGEKIPRYCTKLKPMGR